jgi:histone-lysine N-methyltransferase SETMAR
MRKVASRYVAHQLSQKHKEERVRICQENLKKLNDGTWRLSDIITGDESWFYHRQLGHKQSNYSWIGQGQSPRTVVRRNRFEPKTMFSIFFKTTGLVHISYVDNGKAIDAESYIENCLKPTFAALKQQRPKSGMAHFKIHHDNARPHIAHSVTSFLKQQKVQVMEQPPYSPDLSPSDFWLLIM